MPESDDTPKTRSPNASLASAVVLTMVLAMIGVAGVLYWALKKPDPLQASATNTAMAPAKRGQLLYLYCVGCHKDDGKGQWGLYPPLAGSGYVIGDPERLVRIMLEGVEGPINVGGHMYNQPMPGWPHLSDQDVALLGSFIRQNWGNESEAISEAFVTEVRQRTVGRPLNAQDLGPEWPEAEAAPTP